MPVPDTVQRLRSARALHKAWLVRAEALVNGLPLNKEQTPVAATSCEFGLWFYGSGSRLKEFSVFSEIESVHHALHRVYADIYELLCVEPKGMGKLFGQSKKTKTSNHLKAKMLLTQLQSHYDMMMDLLAKLEKDYLELRAKPASPMKDLQTQSFRDVAKMMDELEKDVDSWLK